MLSPLPHLSLTRRTYMWPRFYNRYGDLARPQNLERCLAAMVAQRSIRAFEPDVARIRREFAAGEPSYARLFALFHAHYAEGLGKSRWGEQLGFVERYAAPIFAALPGARMIHMVRDFRTGYEVATGHARHRKGKLGWSVARWLESVRLMEHNLRTFPGQYKAVRYEALMTRPEQVLRDVCEFLGEDAGPVLSALPGAALSASSNGVGHGVASNGAGWAPSVRELAFVQSYAARPLRALAYETLPLHLSWRDRLAYALVEWPANRAGMMAWRVLQSRQSFDE